MKEHVATGIKKLSSSGIGSTSMIVAANTAEIRCESGISGKNSIMTNAEKRNAKDPSMDLSNILCLPNNLPINAAAESDIIKK